MIEFLEIFLFGQGNVQQATPIPIGIAIGGAALNVIGGIFGAGKAKKTERAARREKAQLTKKAKLFRKQQTSNNKPSGRSYKFKRASAGFKWTINKSNG